jgi:hypothetical protein
MDILLEYKIIYNVLISSSLLTNIWRQNQMGESCSAYGWGKRGVQGFGWKIWGKETTWQTKT